MNKIITYVLRPFSELPWDFKSLHWLKIFRIFYFKNDTNNKTRSHKQNYFFEVFFVHFVHFNTSWMLSYLCDLLLWTEVSNLTFRINILRGRKARKVTRKLCRNLISINRWIYQWILNLQWISSNDKGLDKLK